MPLAIVLTTEFDALRKCAEEAAALYKAQDKLLEYGCLAGCQHGHFTDFTQDASKSWFDAIARVADIYL